MQCLLKLSPALIYSIYYCDSNSDLLFMTNPKAKQLYISVDLNRITVE